MNVTESVNAHRVHADDGLYFTDCIECMVDVQDVAARAWLFPGLVFKLSELPPKPGTWDYFAVMYGEDDPEFDSEFDS